MFRGLLLSSARPVPEKRLTNFPEFAPERPSVQPPAGVERKAALYAARRERQDRQEGRFGSRLKSRFGVHPRPGSARQAAPRVPRPRAIAFHPPREPIGTPSA